MAHREKRATRRLRTQASLGFDPDELQDHTLYEVMVLESGDEDHRPEDQMIRPDLQGLDLLPAKVDLAPADIDFHS